MVTDAGAAYTSSPLKNASLPSLTTRRASMRVVPAFVASALAATTATLGPAASAGNCAASPVTLQAMVATWERAASSSALISAVTVCEASSPSKKRICSGARAMPSSTVTEQDALSWASASNS